MKDAVLPAPRLRAPDLSGPVAAVAVAMRRALRKHGIALLALGAFHLVIFFPTLFMGRILSPNDVYYHYEPWASLQRVEAQNPTLDAAATGIQTLASLVRAEPDAFHWNPYLASGIPGFGSSVVLSPFLLLPALLVPLAALYTAILLLKLNFSFVFAYLWLREERMGKSGAAVGAITFAAAGVYSVWWLMHPTNATVLYPAFLYFTARIFHGKRFPLLAGVLLALCAILSGFPAAVAYGAWTAILYGVWLAARHRLLPWRSVATAGAALAIALLVAAPMFVPFVRFLRTTGYLEARTDISAQHAYPLHHFASFLAPYRLGDPAAHLWTGDPTLGYSNGFDEATIYLGLAAIPLALVGLFRRRSANRWFWLVFAAAVLLAIFGAAPFLGKLPGIRYSPLTRLRLLLPPAAAYLAASGAALAASAIGRAGILRSPGLRRLVRQWTVAALALFTAGDLGVFAARFYPYLPFEAAGVPSTPSIELLRAQPGPFRIAPFFTWLYPNSAEMLRLEDVRSHFSSEAKYRAMMLRIDPGSWDSPTVLMFNGLKTNISDPLLSMLGVRYLVEQPNIDIVRWSVLARTKSVMEARGSIRLAPGASARRSIAIDALPFHAAEITASVVSTTAPGAALVTSLLRPETGEKVWSRVWSAEEVAKQQKLYLPVSPYAASGVLLLNVEARGMTAELLSGTAPEGEAAIFYRRVESPVIPAREMKDARIFENLTALPRWWPVWDVRTMGDETLLRDLTLDFSRTAVVAAPLAQGARLAAVPQAARAASVQALAYRPDRTLLATRSTVPFLLATSEKVNRDLRVEIDGRAVRPATINFLFAAVPIEPGEHRVLLVRRSGRGLWPLSAAGLVILAVGVGLERRVRAGRH